MIISLFQFKYCFILFKVIMKYCKKCLISDTRPELKFDNNGIILICLKKLEMNYGNQNLKWEKVLKPRTSKLFI